MNNTIVLTGGGTAGHVMPNIALLPELKKCFNHIIYIGSKDGIEKKIMSEYKDVTYYGVDSAKLIRKLTLKNFALPFTLIKSIRQCYKLLKEIKPKVIFSKGGYVAVPVVIAGSMLKIPLIAHESDSTMGLANKLIYRKCKTMFFSFEEAMNGYEKKGKYSGSPIRKEFYTAKPNSQLINNYSPHKKTLLVVGGSLGSVALNKTIISALPKLQEYNVVNIVGKGKKDNNVKYNNYTQLEFVSEIYNLYALADVVISRAGSNAIFELLAMQKPMILIPLPKDESRGDQVVNADIFAKKNYAYKLDQKDLNVDTLINAINTTIKNKKFYIDHMKKAKILNANDTIIKEIKKYI